MKLLVLMLLSNIAFAGDTYVRPYVRSNGTVVEGHYRTKPDNNYFNNYGSQGNTNPYNGRSGSRSYDDYLNDRNDSNNTFDY